MKLSQFKFKLPEALVALEPPHKTFENEDGTVEKVYRRDECRLMVLHRKSQTVEMFQKDENGKETATEFQDAKTKYMRAESQKIQSGYTYLFRKKILDFYRGVSL